MCIAIFAPSGWKSVPDEYLAESMRYNPDGAGYSVALGDRLKSRKGFFGMDTLRESLSRTPGDAPITLHFRIATAGMVDKNNCHPFGLGIDPHGIPASVIHNGVLSHRSSKQWSDTAFFANDILRPLHRDGDLFRSDTIKTLAELITKYNKLVILNAEGHYAIVNEDSGHWFNGVWYSNNSYIPIRKYNKTSCAWNSWEDYAADDTAITDVTLGWVCDWCGDSCAGDSSDDIRMICGTCIEDYTQWGATWYEENGK